MEHEVGVRLQGDLAWARAVVAVLQQDLDRRGRAGCAISLAPGEGAWPTLRVSVRATELPALPLSSSPAEAAAEALAFLARWGFIGGA